MSGNEVGNRGGNKLGNDSSFSGGLLGALRALRMVKMKDILKVADIARL